MFYKTHKISREDFLQKLDSTPSEEHREKLIMELFDDPAIHGRRGVLSLTQALKIVKDKVEEKEKFNKFTQKYSGGLSSRDLKAPGSSFSSFKDLI